MNILNDNIVILTFTSYKPLWSNANIVGGIERKLETYIKILSVEWNVFIIFYNGGKFYLSLNLIDFVEMDFLKCLEYINPKFILVADDSMVESLKKFDFLEYIYDKFPLFLISQFWGYFTPGKYFRGILANGALIDTKNVFKVGAIYDSDLFFNSKCDRNNIAIYAGRLVHSKNVGFLVSIWNEIYEKFNTKLYLIGGTHDLSYFNSIQSKIDGNIIEYIQCLSTAELKNFYDTCRISIMPSKRESLCWTIVESLACGCTCVVDGNYEGIGQNIKSYIVGESLKCTNNLKKFIYDALEKDIKIDASEFMEQFSIKNRKYEILSFIKERL
jgi:glycosyltransferase involved in cell wall biosynthesis